MNNEVTRVVGLSEELNEQIVDHLNNFSEHLSDASRIKLFDATLTEFCRDAASALDAEIAVWALQENGGTSHFQLLLSGPRLLLEETVENSGLFDRIFHRRLVSELHQSHAERKVESSPEDNQAMLREMDASITSVMSACFGQIGSLEGVVTIYRYEDKAGNTPFPELHLESEAQSRFRFYVTILNRLLDQSYLSHALERQ